MSCGLNACVAICAPSSCSSPASVWEWGGKCGHTPCVVVLPADAAPASVAAGARHRACACDDSRLFLWGSGRALQGLPTLPQAVEGARVGASPHALVCTWRGTAFIADDGCVHVLGPNDMMQHGCSATQSLTERTRGVIRFADGDRCIKLMAGSEHFAALLSAADGKLRITTWGWGEHGQLGNGAAHDSAPCVAFDVPAAKCIHVAAGAAFVVLVVNRHPYMRAHITQRAKCESKRATQSRKQAARHSNIKPKYNAANHETRPHTSSLYCSILSPPVEKTTGGTHWCAN